MAKYLITGGAGFIGSHVGELLIEQGHDVLVLDNLSTGQKQNLPAGVELVEGDIRDHALVKSCISQTQGCFHLAAIASVPLCNEDITDAQEVNVNGTLNIIKAIKETQIKGQHKPLVFASSAAVYGDSQQLPLSEQALAEPISIYGLNKLSCEHYAKLAAKLYGMSVTALRLFNVYGPRQALHSSYSGVISIFINNLMYNKPLRIFGNGEQTRDFIFVKDVALFFLAAMQQLQVEGNFHLYNVCSGSETSINDIVMLLAEITQKQPTLVYEPKKEGDIVKSYGDPNLAGRELSLKASVDLRSGLHQLYRSVLNKK